MKTEKNVSSESQIIVLDLTKIKGEKTLNFLFVLDQKLKHLPGDATAEEQVTTIAKTTMESVNRFPPEQEKLKQEQTDYWIRNKTNHSRICGKGVGFGLSF